MSICSIPTVGTCMITSVVITSVAALGWVLFKAFILFPDIREEVNAKFFGTLNLFGIRPTAKKSAMPPEQCSVLSRLTLRAGT